LALPPLTIADVLSVMKNELENKILTGGREETTSFIRSQKFVGHLHEFVKQELISNGISSSKIYPPKGKSKPEQKFSGFLKQKDQDIVALNNKNKPEIIKVGPTAGKTDCIGLNSSSKAISINVRGQMSSIAKNFDTLYERTFAEALNLHERIPKLVLGELYYLPLVAYDPDEMLNNRISWKEKLPSKYIPSFEALNGRNEKVDFYKYEKVCLLIVDFRTDPPTIVSEDDLISEEIISENQRQSYSLQNMSVDNFVKDIVDIYKQRHGSLKELQ
jgi:hypothetical protein